MKLQKKEGVPSFSLVRPTGSSSATADLPVCGALRSPLTRSLFERPPDVLSSLAPSQGSIPTNIQPRKKSPEGSIFVVRPTGIEPARFYPQEPKSCVSASSTTAAYTVFLHGQCPEAVQKHDPLNKRAAHLCATLYVVTPPGIEPGLPP